MTAQMMRALGTLKTMTARKNNGVGRGGGANRQ